MFRVERVSLDLWNDVRQIIIKIIIIIHHEKSQLNTLVGLTHIHYNYLLGTGRCGCGTCTCNRSPYMQVYITVVISRGNIRVTCIKAGTSKQTFCSMLRQTVQEKANIPIIITVKEPSTKKVHITNSIYDIKQGSHKQSRQYQSLDSTLPYSEVKISVHYLWYKCCIDTYIAANLAISTFTVTDKPEKIICIGVVQHSKA